jgi:hypothetical protein
MACVPWVFAWVAADGFLLQGLSFRIGDMIKMGCSR